MSTALTLLPSNPRLFAGRRWPPAFAEGYGALKKAGGGEGMLRPTFIRRLAQSVGGITWLGDYSRLLLIGDPGGRCSVNWKASCRDNK